MQIQVETIHKNFECRLKHRIETKYKISICNEVKW